MGIGLINQIAKIVHLDSFLFNKIWIIHIHYSFFLNLGVLGNLSFGSIYRYLIFTNLKIEGGFLHSFVTSEFMSRFNLIYFFLNLDLTETKNTVLTH